MATPNVGKGSVAGAAVKAGGGAAVKAGVQADGHWVEYDQFVDQQIRKTRSQVKGTELAVALMTLATGTLGYFLVAALADHWLFAHGFGFWGRFTALVVYLTGSGWFCYRRVLPLVIMRINPIYAAETIERSRPSLKNTLMNFLFLRSQRERMSPAVYQAIEQQAATNLSRVSLETAVDRTRLVHVLYALLAVVVLFATYWVFSTKNPFESVERVVMPWAKIDAPSRVTIADVRPGDKLFYRGEAVEVSAEIKGLKSDEPVRVLYTTADHQAVDQPAPMYLSSDGYRHAAKLPAGGGGLQQDVDYRIEAGDAISPTYHLQSAIAPTVAVESIEYEYPSYTKRERRTVKDTGDIQALEGTRVTIHARANQPLQSANLELEGDGTVDKQPARIDGQTVAVSFTLALSANDHTRPQYAHYRLRPENRPEPQPVQYRIDVLPDLPPEIKFLAPQQEAVELPQNGRLTLEVRAVDPDYALSDVVLAAKSGDRTVLSERLLPEGYQGGPLDRPFTFDPQRLGLKVGEKIEYWATARDNHEPEANSTSTPVRTITIVSPGRRNNSSNQVADKNPGNGQPGANQNPADKNSNNQNGNDPSAQPNQGDRQQNNPNNNSGNREQQNGARDNNAGQQPSGAGNSEHPQDRDPSQNPGQNPQDKNPQDKNSQDNKSQDQQQKPDKSPDSKGGGGEKGQQGGAEKNGSQGGKSDQNNSGGKSGTDGQASDSAKGASDQQQNPSNSNSPQSGDSSHGGNAGQSGRDNSQQNKSDQENSPSSGSAQQNGNQASGGQKSQGDSAKSDAGQQSQSSDGSNGGSKSQQPGGAPKGNDKPAPDGSDDKAAVQKVVDYQQKHSQNNSGEQKSSDKQQSGEPNSQQKNNGQQQNDSQNNGQKSDKANDQSSLPNSSLGQRDASGSGNHGNQSSTSPDAKSGQSQSGNSGQPGSTSNQPGGKTGDKSAGNQQTGAKPNSEKPSGDKPSGDKPAGDKPSGDKPAGQTANGQKSDGQQSRDQKTETQQKPAGDATGNQKPSDQPSNAQQPNSQGANGQKPAGDSNSAQQKPDSQPNGQRPTGDAAANAQKSDNPSPNGAADQPAKGNSGSDQHSGDKSSDQNQSRPEPGNGVGHEKADQHNDGDQTASGKGAQTKPDSNPADKKPASEKPKSDDHPNAQGGDPESHKGNSGAGHSDKSDDKGSPSPQQDPSKPANEHKQDNGSKPDRSDGSDDGAKSPSNSPHESNSKSDKQDGDRSGGGASGGGQNANQQGTGGPGKNTAADQGNDSAPGKGNGETSHEAGGDKKSDQQTGQSGHEQGHGSDSKSANPNNSPSKPGGAQPPSSQDQQDGSAKPDSPQDQNNTAQGGGTTGIPRGGSRPGAIPDSADYHGVKTGTAANVDYARKQFDLALDKLKKGNPDLLHELNWTADDARRLAERLEQMKQNAQIAGPKGDDARREMDDMLRSLGQRSGVLARGGDRSLNDSQHGLRESHDSGPPADYQEQFNAFQQGAARGGR